MRFIILLLLASLAFFSGNGTGREVIRSSVSMEFIDGLHVKYLKNIARHMKMEIEIIPMPFARRIKELRQGNIDIMVGLQRESDEQDEVLYISPSYETLRHTFFIRKENINRLNNFNDLTKLSIGVTRNAKYFTRFHEQADLSMVPVSTLWQKIQLLRKGRVDTFIHFQESALPQIADMGWQDEIVMAKYQPIEVNRYYVTLSQNSPLIGKKHLFEQAVTQALAGHEFADIRRRHYLSQSSAK